MNERTEVLTAFVAAGLVFVGIVAPEPVLIIGLGALALALAARLAEPHTRPAPEVQNRR